MRMGLINFFRLKRKSNLIVCSQTTFLILSNNFIFENYCLDDFNFDFISEKSYSEFKTQAIGYISGYVVKRIKEKVSCTECVDSLVGSPRTQSVDLITTKDYGEFMSYPSSFAQKVMNTADKIIEEEIKSGNWLKKNTFLTMCALKLQKSLQRAQCVTCLAIMVII